MIPSHIYNSEYTKELTWFYNQIKNINAFEIYDYANYDNFEDFNKEHGTIITFNIKKFNNEYIGYKEVENVCYK